MPIMQAPGEKGSSEEASAGVTASSSDSPIDTVNPIVFGKKARSICLSTYT